jgi:hypothetical protein
MATLHTTKIISDIYKVLIPCKIFFCNKTHLVRLSFSKLVWFGLPEERGEALSGKAQGFPLNANLQHNISM